MVYGCVVFYFSEVAPLAGAWIEILNISLVLTRPSSSLPSRERGLKFIISKYYNLIKLVAPLAGAWIEMIFGFPTLTLFASLPSRERGLKYQMLH